MRRVVLRVLVVLIVLEVLEAGGVARAQDRCGSSIPVNVQGGLLTQDMVAIIQSSPTFRTQCDRIASAGYLRVDVELVQPTGAARAETTITRYQSGALRADVKISFGQDYRELIAHEFEHVIEQLDGVNLRAEAQRGGAWLVDTRVFETRRATEAGLRVRRECDRSDAHASAAIHDQR
jgi:hypothetical protein